LKEIKRIKSEIIRWYQLQKRNLLFCC